MDLNKVVGALTSSGVAGGFAGGVAGGALTSALMSKKGRKQAKTLLKVGGLAAVGGLAWKAYQNYQQNQQNQQAAAQDPRQQAAGAATPGAADDRWQALPASGFDTDPVPADESRGLLLVRAMITAALSDGHLDRQESATILAKIEELGLPPEEKTLVIGELLNPRTLEQIVAAVPDQTLAVEVYAASLVAIDQNRDEGRRYLSELALQLELPPLLVEALGQKAQADEDVAA